MNMGGLVCEHHHMARLGMLFIWAVLSAIGQNLLISCETTSPPEDVSGSYSCDSDTLKCQTFVILRANSCFNSLSNVSYYLGLNRRVLASANGLAADTEFVPEGQLLLIPVECRCNGSFYEANLMRSSIKGESFFSISQSLQGLTTCRATREKNQEVYGQILDENVELLVPLRCSCPEKAVSKVRFLVSYPVTEHDSVSSIALKFNTTEEAIVSANNKFSADPFTSVLVPLEHKPVLDPLAKLEEPKAAKPAKKGKAKPLQPMNKTSKKAKKSKGKLFVMVIVAVLGVVAVILAFIFFNKKKKKQTQSSLKEKDLEMQQLNLSVRTTSDKKVSFEGSQGTTRDSQVLGTTTPRKLLLETFAFEDLQKATENFDSSNHIEGSVYHGLLKGKNLAIKLVKADFMAKVDFGLLSDPSHFHPNVIRLLGTCLREGDEQESESCYLVFEYAKNGSLKDWIHNKLAIKNEFIDSCYCFLAWNQRVRICHDVALALKHMHQIGYVHCNIKSRNIFLDEDFNAKVGNFGMSKCVDVKRKDHDHDHEHAEFGYLAPESGLGGSTSPETDVFAYGMVLLEVLTAQKPETLLGTQGKRVKSSEKLRSVLEHKEELKEMMDTALGENYSVEAAFELASIARACVHEEPKLRPNASEIAEKVSRLVEDEDDEDEEEVAEKGNLLVSESSCKPLVINKAVNE